MARIVRRKFQLGLMNIQRNILVYCGELRLLSDPQDLISKLCFFGNGVLLLPKSSMFRWKVVEFAVKNREIIEKGCEETVERLIRFLRSTCLVLCENASVNISFIEMPIYLYLQYAFLIIEDMFVGVLSLKDQSQKFKYAVVLITTDINIHHLH